MMNAKVTWNSSNISDLYVSGTYQSYSNEGVTLRANADMIDAFWMSGSQNGISFNAHATGGFTFSNTLGKNFTKIEMTLNDYGGWDMANLGNGWNIVGDPWDVMKAIWTGNASSTVYLLEDESHFSGENVKRIVFYFEGDSEEPDPTYTVALRDGTANADKVTLSATSVEECTTVTVTPNEECEITAFSASYVVVEDQVGSIYEIDATLNPETGAYSFKMPAADVTIDATIDVKLVPEGDIFAGFTATAGSGGFNNEGHANLVDNKFTSADWTKWCAEFDHMSVPTGETGDACWWIDFEASAALNLTGYILTTGNDTGNEHGRNPRNWLLKAKLNADDAWTTIATVTGDVTMKNLSFKDYKFFVDQPGSYQYFRFEVFANQGANVMQLCELRLIGTETPEPVLVTANTLQLHVNDAAMGSVALQNPSNDIIDNGDGTYDVPEGAEVTLQATPNEGYEFIGWKASSTICDFNECVFVALPTNDNPLTFDMNQEVAIMAEFAAVAPQPDPAGYTEVSSFEALQTALQAGNNVRLTANISCTSDITLNNGQKLILDGNGFALNGAGSHRAFYFGGDVTIVMKDLTINAFDLDAGGGAIRNYGTLVLDGCTVSGNHTDGTNQGGGAIENGNNAKLYAYNTTFSGNYSSEIGGAINNYRGNLYLANCSFENNYTSSSSAYYGGAIGINNGNTNQVRIINCSFSENKYGTNAGASDLGIYSNPSEYTIAGCTGITIQPKSGSMTTYNYGTATLDYSDLNDIQFSYTYSDTPPTPTAVVIGDLSNAEEVTAFLNTYNGQTVPDLTINRPVLNNMYNTLCLPFNMDADQIANSSLNGVEIYEFVDADVTNDELYLYTSEEKHEIVAGRPYLVKFSAASQLDNLNFINVVINNADLDNQAVTIKGVTFKGTFQPIVLGAQTELDFNGGHLFLMTNNTLMWPNTDNPLKPFRAYFTVNVDAGQSAGMPVRRGMPAHIGGPAQIPTGVENVQGDNVQSTKVVENGVLYIIKNGVKYNAQGQVVK
jgi:hypothetical protein